jgi:hypothetical protein
VPSSQPAETASAVAQKRPDSESVLSGYLCMSSSAPQLFGDRLDDFAGEVRAPLANRSADGNFWDWPGDTEVVMAHKPDRTTHQVTSDRHDLTNRPMESTFHGES